MNYLKVLIIHISRRLMDREIFNRLRNNIYIMNKREVVPLNHKKNSSISVIYWIMPFDLLCSL